MQEVQHHRLAQIARVAISFHRNLPIYSRLSTCRFSPTCSEYAVEALRKFGAIGGAWLMLRRLLRCHPFAGWGADPLP